MKACRVLCLDTKRTLKLRIKSDYLLTPHKSQKIENFDVTIDSSQEWQIYTR